MNSETSTPPLINSVVILAGVAIVLLAMQVASDILSPVLLALVLALTASPLLYWFIKRGAPSQHRHSHLSHPARHNGPDTVWRD